MRCGRELHGDRVAGPDRSAAHDDRHHAGLADQPAVGVPVEGCGHEPGRKPVQLGARVTQPGDLDDGLRAEAQPGSHRQREQVEALRRDVLTELAGADRESAVGKLGEQFAVHEVHLAQVGLAGVAAHPRAVLHGPAEVRVAVHAERLDQPDLVHRHLAEAVLTVTRDGDDLHGGQPRARKRTSAPSTART